MGYSIDSMMIIDTMKLKKKFDYDVIFETGTAKGNAAEVLQYMFDKVYTCEIDPKMLEDVKTHVSLNENVQVVLGNSPDCLRKWFGEIGHDKFFLFLDAHWDEYWPLLDELQVVVDFGYKPVIIIHDFDCGHPGWQYDAYNNHILNWDYIKDKVCKIYGEDGYEFKVSQVSFKTPPKRGCAYIYPKV
jgi:hypothetical protein